MNKMFRYGVVLSLLAILGSQISTAVAQGTAFTYQGRLNAGAGPASGSYDLSFALYPTNATGTPIAGPVTNTAVAVTNGLFTTTVNFSNAFTGASNWLQIAVSTNGANTFSPLSPRQQLTPVPYAITAQNVSGTIASANLAGADGNAVTFTNASNSFAGAFAGNGGGLTNVNAATLAGSIADARLSANVALLDATQTFTGANTFAGANQGLIVNGGPLGTNLFTGLGLQYNAASGEAAIISSLNDNRSFLTFYTKQGTGVPPVQQMKIDRNGVVMIDGQAGNNGVLNDNTTNGAGLVFGGGGGEGIASQRTPGLNQFGLDLYTGHTHRLSILNNGNVGIGTTNPATALQVNGTITATAIAGVSSLTASNGTPLLSADQNGNSYFGLNAGGGTGNDNTAIGFNALGALASGSHNVAVGYGAGQNLTSGNNNIDLGNAGTNGDSGVIRIGVPGVQTETFIAGVIQNPSVTTINITGGSDLAEPFSISSAGQAVAEGAVVVIDAANPGRLKLADQPYDTGVAGVVSGANGIHPGIQMHQQGMLEGGRNVALSGRVYVQADTSNGPIQPGDLLTTSSTPGRAMKVTDHVRAAGAILGKAMTGLADGSGLVLVLVSLQ